MTKAKGKSPAHKSKLAKKVPENKISVWLEENYKPLSYSILGLAFLLRLWLLIQLPNMPFSEMHQNPDLDMNFFDAWGDRIAHGDFLTDTVWHPYHNWHKEAADYLGAKSDEEGRAMWNAWYGGKTYHQEPLYAQILGICKMPGGNGHMLMYILQILSTLFSIWMIIWLGRHYFGPIAGISGGLLFSLYSPAIFFDVFLLRTSLTTCYMLSLLFVAEKLMMGKSRPWIFGLLGGLGYLLQSTAVLLWIPLLIRWLYVRRQDVKRTWQTGIAFAGVLSLLAIRNSIAGVGLFSVSSVGPVTFILSNFPNYRPEMGFVFFQQVGKVLEMTHGKMLDSAMKIISVHPSFFSYIGLEFKKLALVFHWYEVPNNVNSYVAMKVSLPLRLAFIPWSFIGALGLTGMIFNIRHTKTLNLLFGVLSQVVVMVAFYVLCRFRVPMVAMMAVYGGYAVQALFKSDRTKKLLVTACLILMWVFMVRPYPKIDVPFPVGELATYFHTYYRERMDQSAADGNLKKGIAYVKEFVNTMPKFIKHIEDHLPLETSNQKDLTRYYGKLYGDLGDFYRDDGQKEEAERCYRIMDKLLKAAE
ncbi:MAG TPA: hypothetical protein VFV79_06145 [Saprospiraceae bacterium]|nr:hypothetical protein [Saprospiraceae bacterium]